MSKPLNHTVVFDGTPVFRGQALTLHHARKHGWKGVLVSADRRKGVAEKYGKLSQAALWAGWIAHKLGFNPANPPGRSTHELRSDGVAYRGPVGRPLAWWQLGLDVSESDQLLMILHSLGYKVRRPYPTGNEAHHLNFTSNPRRVLIKANLIHDPHTVTVPPSRLSQAGLNLIASFEGWVDHVYKDPVGIPTIGYGHVVRTGELFPLRISKYTGLRLLRKDAASAVAAVRKGVTAPLTQNQFDALVCFAFNVGNGALLSSTLLRELNKRDYIGAANQFLRWNKAGGHELPGLTRRREAERRLFLNK